MLQNITDTLIVAEIKIRLLINLNHRFVKYLKADDTLRDLQLYRKNDCIRGFIQMVSSHRISLMYSKVRINCS